MHEASLTMLFFLRQRPQIENDTDTHKNIMSQMTQQYKGMQVQMMKTLQEKDDKIAELTASLEEKDKELEDTKNEKDKAIAMKEAEIAELKEKVRSSMHTVQACVLLRNPCTNSPKGIACLSRLFTHLPSHVFCM